MPFADEHAQAVEDVVHAWTYGSNCLLYEERAGGEDVHLVPGTEPPRALTRTESLQIIHAQFLLLAMDADLDRLRAAGQACYQTAAAMQRTHATDAKPYVRAADLCDRAAELVVSVGAADDESARRRLLAVAEHDTTMATGGLDPDVAEQARRALRLALSEHRPKAARPPGPGSAADGDDAVRYPGPSYDPATGRHRIGVTSTGEAAYWQLRTPGRGMENGVVCGPPGSGKSNLLRMVLLETTLRPEFELWLADPGGRHEVPAGIEAVAARTAADHRDTVELLRAAADLAEEGGPLPDPSPERPGVVVAMEDCHLVFADDLEATRLAERIVTAPEGSGVGLVVTAPGAGLAYYGGSPALRAALAGTNCFPLGLGGRRMLAELRGGAR